MFHDVSKCKQIVSKKTREKSRYFVTKKAKYFFKNASGHNF